MLLNYQQKQADLDKTTPKANNIFILHGLFGSLSNLAGLANVLQAKHNIITVDLRNHGNSPHHSSMTYEEMAADIFLLADKLDITNFSIVGHSMGGKVAMMCALQQPQRINKLVVVDIAPIAYPDKHQRVLKGLQRVFKETIKSRKEADAILQCDVEEADVRQFLLKSLQKQDGHYQLQFNLPAIYENYTAIRDWPTTNNRFEKNVLFIKGEDSGYISAANQSAIKQLFPNAELKIIAHTGHWLHADKPKIFNRLVSQFFN